MIGLKGCRGTIAEEAGRDGVEMTTIFRGDQWAVTSTGIRPLEQIPELGAAFAIDGAKLVETIAARKGVLYKWPLQLAENTHVDICDFFQIFVVALMLHQEKYEHEVDFSMLEASFHEARRITVSPKQE